jgi:acyl-CoA thioester hydrolase
MTAQAGWVETLRERVAVTECDHFGHMNVQFYVARISDATVTLSHAIGVTAGYVRAHRRSLVTVHQDIAYLAALTAGDLVVMHGGVLSVDREKLQFMHRMTRVEDGDAVMTAKVFMLGMDLERRTSVALDEAILTRARQLLVEAGHS